MQEFIQEAKGADIRCFVVGGKVIAAIKRQGGSASLIKISAAERATAVNAAKAMGLNVCGVDLLRSNHGPVVMKVNSSPGLEGIETATQKDIADMIIDFIEKNAGKKPTNLVHEAKVKRFIMATQPKNQAITIAGETVLPGEQKTINVEIGKLFTHSELTAPIQVWCERQTGPILFISTAIHGDELNGVEIIRRLLKVKSLKRLKGTLMTVPIVNLHGFINHSRYLPDRRDLNRSFPGSANGSIAGRLAHTFMKEVVEKATHGIDLHTGAINRTNLPQIRADLDTEEVHAMANAFSAPVMLNADLRDGSLRAAAVKRGIPILLYEAGEALRFDEFSIRAGVNGIINVMRHLQMLPASRKKSPASKPVIARSSFWIRAPHSEIFRSLSADGARVEAKKTLIGVISDPFGQSEVEVYSPYSGIIIGQMKMPLVNQGEALYHIARFARSDVAEEQVDTYQEALMDESNLLYPTEDIPTLNE